MTSVSVLNCSYDLGSFIHLNFKPDSSTNPNSFKFLLYGTALGARGLGFEARHTGLWAWHWDHHRWPHIHVLSSLHIIYLLMWLLTLLQWAKKLSYKRSNFTCQANCCSKNKGKPIGNCHNKGRHPVLCCAK